MSGTDAEQLASWLEESSNPDHLSSLRSKSSKLLARDFTDYENRGILTRELLSVLLAAPSDPLGQNMIDQQIQLLTINNLAYPVIQPAQRRQRLLVPSIWKHLDHNSFRILWPLPLVQNEIVRGCYFHFRNCDKVPLQFFETLVALCVLHDGHNNKDSLALNWPHGALFYRNKVQVLMLTADQVETNDPYLLLAGRLSRTYCTEGDLASENAQEVIWAELSHYYNEVKNASNRFPDYLINMEALCPPSGLSAPGEDMNMMYHLLGELHSVPYPGVEGLPTLEELGHGGCKDLESFPCDQCGELVYKGSLTPRLTTFSSPISTSSSPISIAREPMRQVGGRGLCRSMPELRPINVVQARAGTETPVKERSFSSADYSNGNSTPTGSESGVFEMDLPKGLSCSPNTARPSPASSSVSHDDFEVGELKLPPTGQRFAPFESKPADHSPRPPRPASQVGLRTSESGARQKKGGLAAALLPQFEAARESEVVTPTFKEVVQKGSTKPLQLGTNARGRTTAVHRDVDLDASFPLLAAPLAPQPIFNKGPHTWDYEVFISHAGTLKDLARELESDLKGMGFRVFVDINALRPGDKANDRIVGSAQRAPIGLVLINKDFLERGWPMRELRIIVEADTFLPVILDMSHSEFEAAWRASELTSQFDEQFFQTVSRTTFLVEEVEEWRGKFRQRVCFSVARMFVKKVCSSLEDKMSSAKYLRRALKAAEALSGDQSFLDLTKGECKEVENWIAELKSKLD